MNEKKENKRYHWASTTVYISNKQTDPRTDPFETEHTLIVIIRMNNCI